MNKTDKKSTKPKAARSQAWKDFGKLSKARKAVVITASIIVFPVFTPAGIYVFCKLVTKLKEIS